MQNNENKTKEELIKIIEQLEKKVEDLSSMQSYPVQERFREKYSTRILDALPDMLTVFDHDANIIELASSPSTNHVEGINADNITHSNVKDILPPEAYESVRQNMDRVILTGESSTSRHDLMLDGILHHYENRIFPLDNEYLLCMCRDISEQWNAEQTNKKQQKELEAARIKAEESDRLKSAFLANMSHEIRTPLNAIVGFSHLIAESDDAEERKTYYNIVNANNERLLQLINEILDLSKIESGTIEFSFGPASLHNLCREVYDAHIFRTPQGVSLVYESSDESLMIETDKNRVFQVISNLIGNAVKFTKEGSISYGYKLVDNQIVFHVTDTGTGIEPEKVGRVFERFAKLNNHAQGTGLGLSICKSIVERLGGKISVSSEFGKGTTFTFTLPYTVAESVSVDSEKKNGDETSGGMSSAVNTRHACILVAEDTDSNFDLLEAILGKEHRIIRAHDGMEVVTMFDEVKPDLILMDIKMPNLDGLEATKIIRELSATVPIIAQSAFAYEQDRKAAKEAGCNDFIAKPIADDKLKAMIHKWLSPP